MTIVVEIIIIILANIESLICEKGLQTCVYDIQELKEQLENAINKIDELENKVDQLNVELKIQKNMTKGNK